jgi:hypothetical protein
LESNAAKAPGNGLDFLDRIEVGFRYIYGGIPQERRIDSRIRLVRATTSTVGLRPNRPLAEPNARALRFNRPLPSRCVEKEIPRSGAGEPDRNPRTVRAGLRNPQTAADGSSEG